MLTESIFDFTLLKNAQILLTLFLAILFLQSGLDKVFFFQSNKTYIAEVFSRTFLKPIAGFLFLMIIFLEVVAGLLTLGGTWVYYSQGQDDIAILGIEVAAVSLLSLFFGQRIAKDYTGAAALVPYFLLSIFGLFLFSLT
jgi:hypothetical protein